MKSPTFIITKWHDTLIRIFFYTFVHVGLPGFGYCELVAELHCFSWYVDGLPITTELRNVATSKTFFGMVQIGLGKSDLIYVCVSKMVQPVRSTQIALSVCTPSKLAVEGAKRLGVVSEANNNIYNNI